MMGYQFIVLDESYNMFHRIHTHTLPEASQLALQVQKRADSKEHSLTIKLCPAGIVDTNSWSTWFCQLKPEVQ